MHYLIDVVAGIALVPLTVAIGIHGDSWWDGFLRRLGERFPAARAEVVQQARSGRMVARVFQGLLVAVAIYWVGQIIV
jgi:hypothetical protein